MSVKIFTDAGSNLFKKLLDEKKADITILPMSLDIDNVTYHCYSDDINVEEMSEEFYKKMENGMKPKTSLVSPGLFYEMVEEEVKKGNDVLYISLAESISGCYQSGVLMASQINDEYKREAVKVLNSKTASFGEGMMALYAYELAKKGHDLQKIYDLTLEYSDRVRSEFTVDTIKYLAQSGRASKITAVISNVLSIKPLLYGSEEGRIEVTGKCHGRMNALKTLANQVIQYIKDKDQLVYIAHCNAIEDANKVKNFLNEAGINNIEIYFYDLITGAHVGPGTIAVFYEGTKRSFDKKGVIDAVLNKFRKKDENAE